MMGKWEPNWVTAKLIALVAVSLSIFQMWQPIAGFIPAGAIPFEDIFGMQPAVYFRPVHLLFILVLGLFLYPVRGGPFFKVIDVALVCDSTADHRHFEIWSLRRTQCSVPAAKLLRFCPFDES